MLSKLRKISLSNWILIGMVLGIFVGLFLNFFVTNPFIKDTILIDNIFYLGGNGFIRLMKMLVVPLVSVPLLLGLLQFQISEKLVQSAVVQSSFI